MTDDALIEKLKIRVAQDTTAAARCCTASDAVIDATEAKIGAPLPPLLRRVYQEVANGGFGPAYGLLGAEGGHRDDDVGTLAEAYRTFSSARQWPRGLLVLLNEGCAQYVCLATGEFDGSLVWHDEVGGLTVTPFTLKWLLEEWCAGRDVCSQMLERVGEREGINPFTKKPHVFAIRRPRGFPWPGYVPIT